MDQTPKIRFAFPDELFKECEETFYAVEDSNGKYRFFTQDPLVKENREKCEVFVENLWHLFGHGGLGNPIVLKVRGFRFNRATMPFGPELVVKIRRGDVKAHFEDYEGNLVIIDETRTDDPKFALKGTVLAGGKEPGEERLYSVLGNCKDGDWEHSLVAVSGDYFPR